MLKWLVNQFGAGEEDLDSLASEKGLEAFIARLPPRIPANTVEAVSEQFEKAGSLEMTPAQLRRALKRLDERAQDSLATLCTNLFEDTRGRQLSDAVWLTAARFYRNVHTGYKVCLESLRAHEKQSKSERTDALLLACRAMAALGRFKTFLRMRYRDVDQKYWEDTMELAAWSANSDASHTLIELYPESGCQTTFEREYLTALLFEAAPVANLLPAQMLALDLILRRFAASFAFADSYRDSTPFVIDFEGESVVKRWLKGLSARPGLRFFGIADAHQQLAKLHHESKSSRGVPSWLAAAHLDLDSYRTLLELLVSHWSVAPPQRRHRRARLQGDLRVAHGVGQVRRVIAASEHVDAGGRLDCERDTPHDDTLFGGLQFGAVAEANQDDASKELSATHALQTSEPEDEDDPKAIESWSIVDVSETGLGAVAQSHGGWARTGMLVGIRRMGQLRWQPGTLRRLSRSSRGRLSVGMSVIPGMAYCVQVRIPSKDDNEYWTPLAESVDVHHDGILVRDGESLSILVEIGVFGGETECMIGFAKRWHPAKLERVLEHGYDYEQIALAILGDQAPT